MSKVPELEGAQVIHVGKVSRKQINQYKKGYGKMFTEVQNIVAKAKRDNPGSVVVPSVVTHRKKGKQYNTGDTLAFHPSFGYYVKN
jgi:hypothetical protein